MKIPISVNQGTFLKSLDFFKDKKLFVYLWLVCLLGAWASIPYQVFLMDLSTTTLNISLLWQTTLGEGIISGVACFSSFYILPKTDLKPFFVKNAMREVIYPGVISGIFCGLLVHFLLFKGTVLSSVLSRAPAWAGSLASINAAFNQEVLFRLFLFSLIFFLINKCFKNYRNYRWQILWSANIISALIFGISHLPGGLAAGISSGFDIFQVLYLNTLISLVFGWLFFSRGFWAASLAHGFLAITLHGFFA